MEKQLVITGQNENAVRKGLDELLVAAKARKTFKEAYENGEPYYNNRRKKYIIPTEMLNLKFGQPYYLMPKWLSDFLFSFGGKRTTRQIYDNSKRQKVVSVWIFEEK